VSWLRRTGLRLLLSVGLGFALWMFVSFTQNPDRSILFDSVPVEVEGLPPNLVVVDQQGLPRTTQPSVDITVEGEAETIQGVRQSDLRAFVDLSELGAGEHSNIPVIVERNRPGLARLSFSSDPAFLAFRIEQEITRTVPLTIEVTGSVPFSFEKGPATLTYENEPIGAVQVRGPQSRVERVTVARVTADIDRLTANFSSPRSVEPLAQDGQVVEGVTAEPASVNVLVPIISSAGIKRVPVVPAVVGAPASGYIVAGIAVQPEFVRLTGSGGPLDSVESIGTADVAIAGASTTITRSVALSPPPNTTLYSGEPNSVVVTVRIVPIERPFQITIPAVVQVADAPDGLSATLSPQVVSITLTGSAAQISALDPTSIRGVVSLRNLGPGTYNLEPAFQLPAGIRQSGETPRVTVTLRLPPTAVPEATPTEPPATPPPPELTPAEQPGALPSPGPTAAAATPAETPTP
jgi:YbbR domain-containing protein